MANKKNDDVVEQLVKKPRGVGKNSPVIGDNGILAEAGDNAKYLSVSMELMNLPDIDLHDVAQVQTRLNQYFKIHAENDMKPTVAGMGLALNGMDRRRLWEIKTDAPTTNRWVTDLPTPVKDAIKKAYKLMENLWENYMQNGKINPVSGIFLGKNNFGYQDKTEYVVTPNVNNDADYSKEDIMARYAIDSPTIEQLSDSSDS